MKGLAIETIGFILIALVGIGLLIAFVSTPLTDLARDVFCYFYQDIFSKNSDTCKPVDSFQKVVKLLPETSEDLARNIAAYSILCWESSTKSLKTKDTNCYKLLIESGEFDVSETNVTDILMNEGGCNTLENSIAKDKDGNDIDYSGRCGVNDKILWDIDVNVIVDQKLILIKYDDSLKSIVVKG